MNRGSRPKLPTFCESCCGFNEAPIHESGKSRQEHRLCPHGTASMRPRFMNRGSPVGLQLAVIR